MRRILANKYEVMDKIGEGGMGRVYRVRDLHLDIYLAVKEMDVEGADVKGKETLSREASILKEMIHPGLPRVIDFFQENGKRYLVMEYIDGITLQSYLEKNGAVRQEEAVRLAAGILNVLQYLHNRRPPVIYQDLKPSNIMLCRDGGIKLVDFGAALSGRQEDGSLTVKAGTYGYAAPEQISGHPAETVDIRSDFYAFGATLFYVLTGVDPGKPPFLVQSVRDCDPALSEGLDKIIQKCTSRLKKDRYQNDAKLMDDLSHYKELDQKRRILNKTGRLAYHLLLAAVIILLLAGYESEGSWKNSYLFSAWCCSVTSLLFKWLAFGGGKHYRPEKNVWLTEKKSVGLFLLFLLLFIGAADVSRAAGAPEIPKQQPPSAGETAQASVTSDGETAIRVTVRDGQGRKLLIRYGAVYCLKENLYLELPGTNFEQGREYDLEILCTDRLNGSRRHSRILRLAAEASEQPAG